MGWDIATVNEERLIDLCHKAEKEIGATRGLTEGDQVIQLSDHIAVKYGYGVIAVEVATQELYVPGQNLADVDLETRKDILPRIAKIAVHLGQIQAGHQRAPGPVGGGEPRGYLWGDDGANTVYNSASDLNTYMNKRLKLRNDSIDLAPHPLVLCHLDLCRRNFILKDDGVSFVLLTGDRLAFIPASLRSL
ncbi:uncharacterized protein BDW47DRAFT_125548 [Aspergillus candidus]|uniref:Aminoglycoside phosphotransferase domain-containing protein n=1 Tax=Aspergillus candidus TaxID=41067 RepID=A0A2I2FCU0_ASPCN|nr:hypothetical protein BDW47DRAFT_125548 [Aspergillus candidus]PLB38407.1 hypothetical protein BDW47DRAFT_125548 [Aspergillus candidus]